MKTRILLQKPFYPIALFSMRGQLKWRMTSPWPYVLFATKAAKELYYEMTKEVVQRIHSIIRARECQFDDAGSHPAFSKVVTILLRCLHAYWLKYEGPHSIQFFHLVFQITKLRPLALLNKQSSNLHLLIRAHNFTV